VDRVLAASLACVAYAVAAVVYASGAPTWAHAGVVPLSIVLVLARHFTRFAERDDAAKSRTALRLAIAFAMIAAIGLSAHDFREGRLMLAVGTAGAALAGLVATTRMQAEDSLVARAARRGSHGVAFAFVTLAWAIAIGVAGALAFTSSAALSLPIGSDTNSFIVASLVSLAIITATAALELQRRRLELGAADRLRSFATLSVALLVAALLAGALGLVHLVPLLTVTTLTASLLAGTTAVAKRPETVGRVTTQLVVLAVLAVIPAIALAAFAKANPTQAPLAVAIGAVIAAIAGLAAPRVAEQLLPRTEPWTQAFEAALRAAAYPDPEPALERVLVELASLSLERLATPSLFRFEPPTITVVDRAGYARSEPITVPETVARVAASEPERVLSADSLRSVAVQRPEVRPALAWLEDRHLAAVSVVLEGDMPIGMLGLPLGDRMSALTLAEVRALGALTRLLGAQIAASAKLARSLVREGSARTEKTRAESALSDAQRELGAEQHRGEALTRALADRALVAVYAPTSRIAKEALERKGAAGEPLALLSPAGTDPLPFVAIYHLASPRKSAALYVVDGRDETRFDLEHWRSETTSPFVRARGGTLAIVDPQLLPKLVQAYIGAAFDSSLGMAIVVAKPIDVLVVNGTLDERLADRMEGATIAIPALADRPEDLRALVLDRLTRLGLNLHGRPLGIEPGALALLAEHDFPGNDAELESVLVRAAKSGEGDLVRRRDLLALGFSPEGLTRRVG